MKALLRWIDLLGRGNPVHYRNFITEHPDLLVLQRFMHFQETLSPRELQTSLPSQKSSAFPVVTSNGVLTSLLKIASKHSSTLFFSFPSLFNFPEKLTFHCTPQSCLGLYLVSPPHR